MSREVRHYRVIRAAVVGGFGAGLIALWVVSVRQYLTLFQRATDCGCAVAPLQWSTSMIVGSSLLAVATLYVTVRFAIEIGRRLHRHQEYSRRLERRGRTVWNHVVQSAVLIVNDGDPQAMTIGAFSPRISITTGLLRQLSTTELASVLRHEQAHARAKDPLWSALLESIGATLGWIGGLRQVVNAAFSLREIIADEVATSNYKQTGGLSGAIYKLATGTQPTVMTAFSPNADRVSKLLDTSWELPIRWWSWRTVVAGAVLVAGLWFANGLPAATAAAQPEALSSAACWLQEIMCAQPDTAIILMSPDSVMSHYGW